MVIVIECESCHSRYRLAKALFKESKAIRVRCRKCGGYIVVENPGLPDYVEEVQRSFPRAVPPQEPPPEPPPPPEEEPLPPKEEPAARQMDETTRAMADLLSELDTQAPKPPAPEPPAPEPPAPEPPPAPPEGPPPAPEGLPKELLEPEAKGGRTGYRGPVRVTPHQEQPDGAEALASVLEDLFRTQTFDKTPAPPEAPAGQPRGAEPRRPAPSQEITRVPSTRPPYLSPLFVFIALLWILLLAGAALFFGTDYFQRLFPSGKPKARSAASSFNGKPVQKPMYEIRNLKWFQDSAFEGGSLFAVTGTVTNQGNAVSGGIRVKATIMGKDNVVLSEKWVVAGNQLDNTTLRSMKRENVEAFLSRQPQEGQPGRQVANGQTLPFMAVFFNPPEMVHAVVVKAAPVGGP